MGHLELSKQNITLAVTGARLRVSSKTFIQKWQSRMASSAEIECWTIMARSTWTLLIANNTLTCPASKAENDPIFTHAYEWMKASMTEAGLHAPTPGLTPWWCWVKREANQYLPYLEDLNGLEDPVVLQLSVPASEVALSCFDLWHYVLNQFYIPASEEDSAEFENAWDVAKGQPESVTQLEQRLRKSWQAIFDLNQSRVGMGPVESRSIQGCFWTLKQDWVLAVLEQTDLSSYDVKQ